MVRDFGYLFRVIRRGFGHALELWGFTQLFSDIPELGRLNHLIETNRIAFVLIALAVNAVYDLTQLVIRPDLTAPCNDESQMLDLEQDK